MTSRFSLSIAAGLLSAALFLALIKGLALGALLSYVAPLPLMMAGLAFGVRGVMVASLIGAAGVVLVAGAFSILPFTVATATPAILVVRLALLWRSGPEGQVEWYPPGMLLAWLTGMAGSLIVAGWFMVPDHPQGIEAWITQAIAGTLEMLGPTLAEGDRKVVAALWAPLFPAMVAGSWLLMQVVNAVAAQGLLTRLGRNRRPVPAYGQLVLPDWMGPGLAVAGLGVLAAEGDLGYLARQLAVLALAPFAFLGLTAVHGWARGKPKARLALAVFYGVLFMAFGWAVVAVAGLGLMKYWTNFRRRIMRGGGKED